MKTPLFRKLIFLEAGGTFCTVVRKSAPTVGREPGRVSPCHLALLSDMGQARGKQKRASQFVFQDPSPVQAAKRGPAGQDTQPGVTRVAAQLVE